VYVARHLRTACANTSRQLVANLLCLVLASQQTLSVFPLAITATEILELYLHTDTAETKSTKADVLETLNLQNIIVEAIEKPLRKVTIIAQTLLDVRGTTIDYEILNLLFRGTSLRSSMRHAFSSTSSASTDFENQIERQISRLHSESASDIRSYGHPVLLLSDVTDVGRHGFDGHGWSQGAKVVNTPSLFCFIVSLDDFGVPLIVSLDKHQVVARATFARADTEDDSSDQFVWRVQLANNTKFIVDASFSDNRLLLLLADGSAACINMSEMKSGMSVTLGEAVFPQPPQNGTPHTRVTPTSPKFISQINNKILECHDPKVVALNSIWVAAASHDSDIICVVKDPLAHLNERPIVMQTESNISCICLVGDDLLVAGLETGSLQGFSLPSGNEVFVFEHHEAQINVIRSTDDPEGVTLFVVGSDDATITVFSADDPDPIRSVRFHNDAVIDIVSSHIHKNGIAISADRSGCVLVWTFEPNSPKAPSVVWSSAFPGLRSICLSSDASWLVCTRTNNSPVALPIAEWTREGTGRFHQKCVTALHITDDEKFLLTGGADGYIFVWDLNNSVQFLCTFQQHSLNSFINTISTSSDNTKVVSADATNLICLWRLQSGSIIRILQRSPGGGVARFIHNDFLLVQTGRGVKVFDEQERLFASTTQSGIGCIDVLFASDEIFHECLASTSKATKNSRPSELNSSDSDSDGSAAASELQSTRANAKADTFAISMNPAHEKMRKQCFIGMARGNEDSGVHTVSIACLDDLDKTVFELARGDVEDEFGDEEELSHSDRITAFRFLQPRPEFKPTADYDESPPPPTLLLAATGAEDLTVILWNWCRQQPLKMLQHTNFVTSCLFWYPSLGIRSSYNVEDLRFLSTIDPSFRQCRDGAVVCNLITTQYSDTNKVSLRIFQVRENSRAFQRRLLMKRCGQVTTAGNFPYNMLTVDEISTSSIPVASGLPQSSATCIAIRPSDGLLCTGDETCQVIFWRLSAIRTKKLIDVVREPIQESEYDDEDSILKSLGEGASVGLVPIRRLASRI
jgi:WD40 repeat protein